MPAPLRYTSTEKWISGKPKYGQAAMRCATDESSFGLPHSPGLHVCKTEKEEIKGRKGESKGNKSTLKSAELTCKTSNVHIIIPTGYTVNREQKHWCNASLSSFSLSLQTPALNNLHCSSVDTKSSFGLCFNAACTLKLECKTMSLTNYAISVGLFAT